MVQHNTEQEQHCLQERTLVANVLLNLDPDSSVIKGAQENVWEHEDCIATIIQSKMDKSGSSIP